MVKPVWKLVGSFIKISLLFVVWLMGCTNKNPVTPTGNTVDTAVCLTSNSIFDDQNPAFSPDGKSILFSSKRNGNGKNLNIWKMVTQTQHFFPGMKG